MKMKRILAKRFKNVLVFLNAINIYFSSNFQLTFEHSPTTDSTALIVAVSESICVIGGLARKRMLFL